MLAVSWFALVSPTPGWVAAREAWGALPDGVALPGITGLPVATTAWGPLQRFLERGPVQWLGLRSSSLYLVHEPVVVAFAPATGAAGWAWLAWGSVAVVVALALAAVFFVLGRASSPRARTTPSSESRSCGSSTASSG